MSEKLHVILGATGHVGGIIADRLLTSKRRVRVIGREAKKLEPFAKRGAEVAVGSVDDAPFLAKAFAGAGAAFVLVPPNWATPAYRAFQDDVVRKIGDAVEGAKPSHVVSLSSLGADKASGTGPIAALNGLERRLDRIAGLATLHLRPCYFLENNLGAIGMIKAMGKNGSMLRADLRMQQIATRDIGEVAARRMLALDFKGHEVLELHGQRDLTPAEVTAALGKAIGKPDLGYVQLDAAQGVAGLQQAGLTADMAQLYAEMSKAMNEGHVVPTQPRSAASTTPTSLEWFAQNVFAPAFKAG